MNKGLEQQAREMLAAEIEASGRKSLADYIRFDRTSFLAQPSKEFPFSTALRALTKALTLTKEVRAEAIEEAARCADQIGACDIFEDHRGFCKATARDIAAAIRALGREG